MPKEIKTIKVHPNNESSTIYAYQGFGWIFLNSQEVYSKDSHLESWGRTTYSVTQTTNYVKLTFERDPSTLRNYQKLVELERLYYSVSDPKKPRIAEFIKKLMKVYMIVFGIYCAIGFWANKQFEFLFVAAILIGACSFGEKAASRRYDAWTAVCQKNQEKRRKILEHAYPLLDK